MQHKPLKKRSRRILALATGVGVMLVGSTLATVHFHWFGWIPAPLLDGFAYFLHGVGAIPFVRFIEPVWVFLMAE